MIKAVLFDLDNTLIDFMEMKRQSYEAAVHAMIDAGLEVKYRKAKKIMVELYEKFGIEYHKIFQEFLKKVTGRVEARMLASAIVGYRRTQTGFMKPYPRVRPTLLKLREKGLKLGIVTDAPRMRAWMRIAEMNLTDFFDFVLTLDDVGEKKPSRKPFEKAVKRLELKPEEILFVGDNPARDIKGAKSVGMKTCLAVYGQTVKGRGVKPDFKIRDVTGLLRVVERA